MCSAPPCAGRARCMRKPGCSNVPVSSSELYSRCGPNKRSTPCCMRTPPSPSMRPNSALYLSTSPKIESSSRLISALPRAVNSISLTPSMCSASMVMGPGSSALLVCARAGAAAVHGPEVHAGDLAQGFLLLGDLGTQTYLQELNADNAARLLGDATDALLRWQLATRPGELPPYDEALLRREMDLFPEWYVSRHLGVELSNAQKSGLEGIFRLLVKSALAQPAVYVHRDYMPRNLMVSDPSPGVLDFQDAVLGPITYDMVSLLRDAFVSWDEELVLDWGVRYWEQAKRAGLPVETDFAEFWRAFEWMGLQRHLKVLGIFARINYRDGKPKYLADTPRFIGYVRAVSARYAALAPLAGLLDQLE